MQLSTSIDAPSEAVFAAATDFPHAPEMIEGIEQIEMLRPASDGSPIGQGARFRETRTMFGKRASEEFEITGFDPPRSYTLGSNSCGVQFECTVSVEDEDQGCRLSYDLRGRPTTLIARVVGAVTGPMMKGAMRKCMEQDLSDIKSYIEASREPESIPNSADG